MAKTVLITGANRGIGLGLTTEFLKHGWHVIAGARNPNGARELWELEGYYPKALRLIEIDVGDSHSVANAKKVLGDLPLNILVNNAGVLPGGEASFQEVSEANMLKAFQVNTLGPLRVTQIFLNNLVKEKDSVVATITSRMGSIADNTSGGYYAYRTSKAAVNMVMKSLSQDFEELIPVLIHPGWVQTDMGGKGAPTTIHESVAGIYQVLTGLKPEDRAAFLSYKGERIPW